MKKIKTLFKRDYEKKRIHNEITPGSEWVAQGEGFPTVKIDGTSCLVMGGKLYKRYDAKNGKKPPEGFIAAQDPDPKTGHWPGWVLVGDGPEDKWHREAFIGEFEDGQTYELIGPKIQNNPYKKDRHELIKHGDWVFSEDPPRTFEELKSFLSSHHVEGIVWHRGNGDMVKLRRCDFGFMWP